MAVFAPLTSIITTFFDCKAMTPYNHAFLIVGGFPCWEEVKFVIFTVDHQVAPLICVLKMNVGENFFLTIPINKRVDY